MARSEPFINCLMWVNVNLAAGAQTLQLEGHSTGLALNVGADYKFKDNMYLNADIKKVQLRSDILANGTAVSKARLDPLMLGVGIGWRF